MEFKSQHYRFFVLTILVVLIDQLIKVWVFNSFPSEYYDNFFPVFGDWFKIQYVTNPGMAFGIELFGEYGKLTLTSFRIVASLAIAYYIYCAEIVYRWANTTRIIHLDYSHTVHHHLAIVAYRCPIIPRMALGI